jgi:hypothetical protein
VLKESQVFTALPENEPLVGDNRISKLLELPDSSHVPLFVKLNVAFVSHVPVLKISN